MNEQFVSPAARADSLARAVELLLRLLGAWLASALCLLLGIGLSVALGTAHFLFGLLAFAFVLVGWLQVVEANVRQAFFFGASGKATLATGWMLCTYGIFFLTQTLGLVVGFLSCLEIGHV